MSEKLYSRDILRLAVSIPNQGRLDYPHGSSENRSRTCGSRVIADVCLSSDHRIAALGLEINACALGQASAAILGREAIGKPLAEISQTRDHLAAFFAGKETHAGVWDQMDLLEAARDHKGRHAAILLPYDAVIAATKAALAKQKAV